MNDDDDEKNVCITCGHVRTWDEVDYAAYCRECEDGTVYVTQAEYEASFERISP